MRTSTVLNENRLCVREGCRVAPDVIGRATGLRTGLVFGTLARFVVTTAVTRRFEGCLLYTSDAADD